jgi:hypothetical protein
MLEVMSAIVLLAEGVNDPFVVYKRKPPEFTGNGVPIEL